MGNKYTQTDLKSCLKSKETIIAITCFERIYANVALWLANHTSLSPNTITLSNFFVVVCSAYMFYTNKFIIGGILYLVSYNLDCVDGTLARLKKVSSKYGEFLDVTLDILGIFIISIAISSNLYKETNNILSFGLAIFFPYTSALDDLAGYLTRATGEKALSHSFSSRRYIIVPLQSDFSLVLFTVFGILNIKNPYFYFGVSFLYFVEILTSIIIKIIILRK